MSALAATADTASFRDPAGRVYKAEGAIYRAVFPAGAAAFESVYKSGILEKMASQGRLIASELLPKTDKAYPLIGPAATHVLSHPTLPCITYPYEWPFTALKSAALAHLDLQLALLDENFALSDASAFNMQFDGAHPLHIDVLSITPYREGMHWGGYRQFLHQFFNPLILESRTGVSYAPFFRGTLDGISSDDMLRLLPRLSLARPGLLLHVLAPAMGERHFHAPRSSKTRSQLRPLPKARYRGLLQHLRNIIETLEPRRSRKTIWPGYTSTTSYSGEEAQIKKQCVSAFIAAHQPGPLLDIGCNTGDFAALAIENGAKRVIGLDSDAASADAAFRKSAARKLPFTPLVMDIANPSPAQGWQGTERGSLSERLRADALIALAVIHHLCIGKNIPLANVIAFITSLAPRGIIEFVPKSDPQVVELLRYREDIFPDYSAEAARSLLLSRARIVGETHISESGRILFEYERAS